MQLSLPGLALVLAGPALASPVVNVALNAAFPSPPYLVELVETAAQENETAFFPLLDRVADGAFSDAESDQALYDRFLDVLQRDGHITDPEALATFQLALSLRSAAPRIEAHYQYYRTAVEPAECDAWILWGGKQYCDAALEGGRLVNTNSQERTLAFDRVLGSGRDVILYADPASPSFARFHKAAADLARKGDASYRLRYRRDATPEPLAVSGYGVQLALKKTDYIVIDDRGEETQAQKETKGEAEAKAEAVLPETAEIRPLEKSDLASLGLKAASFIMQSDAPLDTLLKVTQDFPKHASSLAAHNVSSDFEAEHRANRQELVPAGANVLWMNGVQLVDRQIQPLALVDLLRRERRLIHGVCDLGLTGRQAVSLLGHSAVAKAKADDEPQRFDWRDDSENGDAIIWLNNMEKDKRYASFHPSLSALLHPSLPGQLPQVRRDLFHLVVPVDLGRLSDLQLVVDQLLALVRRAIPIRFGIVPLASSPEAEAQAKLAHHLVDTYGLGALVAYLEHWVERQKDPKTDPAAFEAAIDGRNRRPDASPLELPDVFVADRHEEQIRQSRHWAQRLHVSEPSLVFFDGIPIPRDHGWLTAMQQRLMLDLRSVQESLFYGALDDDAWVPGRFLAQAAVRRNVHLFPDDEQGLAVVNVNKLYAEHADLLGSVPVLEADSDNRDDWAALTVVADLDVSDGRQLLLHALQFRRSNPGVRLDVVHNPSRANPLSRASPRLVHSLSTVETLQDLELLLNSDAEPDDTYFDILPPLLATIRAQPGDNMLLLNGRVVGPVSADSFGPPDFQQLLDLERATRILPVLTAVDDLGLADTVSSPLAAAKLTSITALSTLSDLPEGIFESAPSLRITAFEVWNSTYTSFEVGDDVSATIHLVAVLNPASELGQKWAAILAVLARLDGVHLRVFLNPASELAELPVTRFFRYVLDPAPVFDAAGKRLAPAASFASIPPEALLTAGMDVPPAWLVSSRVAVDDLDNLVLGDIARRRGVDRIDAVYELEHVLVEGHSRQVPGGSAPRGAQLVLAAEDDARFADTLIMANLGYFQFKANPGVYRLRLEHGRSDQVYDLESVGAAGWAPVPGDESAEIVLMDFQGTTLYPRLRRKPGMELADVLEDPGQESLLSKGLKMAQGVLGANAPSEHAEINIFSVASGHLYERMLNIMMVSVMRHTRHTVKFWFIEQFLSPSFKDFIPVLAAEYGFRYEMVTFKWPHWLRQQKEKQREIWGYKILFLDVLFPLSLDKVIFVDADQVVRTDMHDLATLDLDGAPYGFAPMCDSREEMEGFRFWKQGYWSKYLRGLPYHISALYVVDLRRFRELAAGDRLRQHYHSLSADPGSLANLDQDLPNHMQHTIPIHTLSQDWLWCETWCADAALAAARTIDLCNNPLTKEPKLDRARRQLPEWSEYDEEIAALARRTKPQKGEGEKKPTEGAEAKEGTKEPETTHEKDEL